jgi:integrase
MKGCRPLTRNEVKSLIKSASNLRDTALITLGFCTGYRISELLSLKLCDIVDVKGRIYDFVSVKAENTKTKIGRTVRLNSDAIKILSKLVTERLKTGALLSEPLFISRKTGGGELRAISRVQAWRVIQMLCELADVVSKGVGTHSLRKTFAARIYEAVKGELGKVQIALGHANISSTISYLSFNQGDIDAAIMSIDL